MLVRILLALMVLGMPLAASAQMSKTDGTLATSNTDYARGRGGVPTMGTCGTTPAVSGTDGAGVITQASGALTTCTLNFSVTYSTTPICTASALNNTTVLTVSPTPSTLVITSGTHAGTTLQYLCALP